MTNKPKYTTHLSPYCVDDPDAIEGLEFVNALVADIPENLVVGSLLILDKRFEETLDLASIIVTEKQKDGIKGIIHSAWLSGFRQGSDHGKASK